MYIHSIHMFLPQIRHTIILSSFFHCKNALCKHNEIPVNDEDFFNNLLPVSFYLIDKYIGSIIHLLLIDLPSLDMNLSFTQIPLHAS